MALGKYHYIETGSLLGIKENVQDIVIPSEEQGNGSCRRSLNYAIKCELYS